MKKQVLIVEDVDVMRLLLEGVLNESDAFKVSGSVANGWDARIELQRRRPDFVLLDEILPGESSVDLLKEFVEERVPVVFMTGIESPTHPILAGAVGRVFKPGWESQNGEIPESEKQEFLTAITKLLGSF